MGDDGWYAFPEDAGFERRYWIHADRRDKWIRTAASGNWSYSGTALFGAAGKPRVCVVVIEEKSYKRHRLMALACGKMTVAQFRDGRKHVVMHTNRREEDEYPDDRPENLKVGTHKDNRADLGRKKVVQKADGHPVRLTRVATGSSKDFESTLVAARFLSVDNGSLRHYLNGDRKSMPGPARGVWDAEYADAFAAPDAVELVGAAASLWLSPSRPNQVFRKLHAGLFVPTTHKTGDGGYIQIGVGNGKLEQLHRLIVKTLRPGAFEAKLAENPGLTEADVDVDHIDGDSSNNSIDNLRLVTRAEHRRKHAQAVEWVGPDGEILGTFECAVDAAKAVRGTNGQSLHARSIRKTCDGSRVHTGGRVFRWVDADAVAAMRAARIAKRKRTEIS